MCITVSLLQKLFDAHDKTELLGAPLGDDRLTRWEILREQNVSPLPDTVYTVSYTHLTLPTTSRV